VLGGYGIINSIPGARDTQPQLEEIYLSDEQIMQSCINVMQKANNLAKRTFEWNDYFWNNTEHIRDFITGKTTIDAFLDTTRNAMHSIRELSKSNFPQEPNKYGNLLSLGIQVHESTSALASFMEDPT
jgi:DNA polymerase III delta prime subunit